MGRTPESKEFIDVGPIHLLTETTGWNRLSETAKAVAGIMEIVAGFEFITNLRDSVSQSIGLGLIMLGVFTVAMVGDKADSAIKNSGNRGIHRKNIHRLQPITRQNSQFPS